MVSIVVGFPKWSQREYKTMTLHAQESHFPAILRKEFTTPFGMGNAEKRSRKPANSNANVFLFKGKILEDYLKRG